MEKIIAFQWGEPFDKIIDIGQEKMWPLKHNSEEMEGKEGDEEEGDVQDQVMSFPLW